MDNIVKHIEETRNIITPIAETVDFPSIFTKEQIVYITQTVAQKAKEVYGDKLKEVILYGSYARGDYEEWSDVDIMIIADADDMTCENLNNLLYSALHNLDSRMNLLLSIMYVPKIHFEYWKEAYPFYKNIDEEGKRICLTK